MCAPPTRAAGALPGAPRLCGRGRLPAARPQHAEPGRSHVSVRRVPVASGADRPRVGPGAATGPRRVPVPSCRVRRARRPSPGVAEPPPQTRGLRPCCARSWRVEPAESRGADARPPEAVSGHGPWGASRDRDGDRRSGARAGVAAWRAGRCPEGPAGGGGRPRGRAGVPGRLRCILVLGAPPAGGEATRLAPPSASARPVVLPAAPVV